MWKRFYLLLVLFAVLVAFILNGLYLAQSLHSEAIGIFSVWPKIIVGIDFERGKFIYSDELIVSVGVGPVTLKFNAFFPYLTASVFGKEIIISWVFYYTPFVSYILFSYIKWYPNMLKYIAFVPMLIIFFAYFASSLKLAHVLFRGSFKDKKLPSILFVFILIFSPSLYCLLYQFHHLQASIFFNLFIISLIQKKYFWSGLLGGITLYSYSPSIFLIFGGYLVQIIRTRDLRKTLFSMILTFSFLIPYIFHLVVAEKINYKQIYGCDDCVFYNAYTEVHNFFGGKIRDLSPVQLLEKLRVTALSIPTLILPFISGFLAEFKKSISISDLFLFYGITYEHSQFHNLSSFFIWLSLLILFTLGSIFFMRTFEFVVIIVCSFMYFVFGNVFPVIPKMLYFLLPLLSVLSVKLFFKLQEFAKDVAFILLFSLMLRSIDIYSIPQKYNDYFRASKVKEVVDFVMRNSLKDIYIFSLPLAFFYYSGGKSNPPTIAIYRWTDEERRKIANFIADRLDVFLVYRTLEKEFLDIAAQKNISLIFSNKAYSIFRRKTN